MEKALLVTIKVESEKNEWQLQDLAEELEELTHSCGVEVIDNLSCRLEKPHADLFIGKGKAEEIALLSQEAGVDTVIFSHDISSTHQRNLEELIGKKTIDRTQLILDIFRRHARSPDGKTQVELAQLEYLLPRLAGKGIFLSRLGGGIGTVGPGEQKLEVDRRRVRKKINKLKKDLEDLAKHRKTIRKKRSDENIITVSLVGYTNAGKSTLLNSLTQANQLVRDSLFTTLDPLSKSLKLPSGQKIVLSDTVGFLHNLPHHLIEAFKATLEEVKEADLLIHVLDIYSPLFREHYLAVLEVLKEIGAGNKPMITALNKIDLLSDSSWQENLSRSFPNPVAVSAKEKQNLNQLIEAIEIQFKTALVKINTIVPLGRMDLVDSIYREGRVNKIEYTETGIQIEAEVGKVFADKLLKLNRL